MHDHAHETLFQAEQLRSELLEMATLDAVAVAEYLDALAAKLADGDWCIFDNTASGAALGNALDLVERLRSQA